MYCQNCGSKVSEDMVYCQTCGIKLAKGSEPAKAPAAPVPEVQVIPNKPVKKGASAVKLAVAVVLVLLLGIILVVVFMSILGRNSGRVADEDFDDAVPNVTLSKTYVEDTEGFSFQYPDGWVVEEVGEWLDEADIEPDDMDVSIIMVLSHTSLAFEIRTSMIIEKSYADESYFYATASDYKEVFSASYPDYKMISLTDVTIDGHRARKHVFKYDNDNGQDCVAIQYFYIANSYLYCVGCYSIESNLDINEPIYDAIIGSYTITTVDAVNMDIYGYEGDWGWEEPDDSYPALGYGLEWVEAPYITTDSLGYSVINGVIENTSGSSKSWVMLTFNLYDANGYQIDQAVDSIQNLRSGDKWKFNATIWNKDAAYWELVDVTVW